MSRVHDMGGRFGDGAVAPGEDAVFAAPWHGRALALTLAAGALGHWTIDASRHARESLSPRDYARFSYYEKWLAALADMLVARGIVTEDELQAGHAAERSSLSERALMAGSVAGVLKSGSVYDRAGPAPALVVGARVRTRRPARNTMVEGGHTRLPGYAAGATGTVVRLHGTHVFPDSNAHGLGEAPEPLYAVAFEARELWGAAAEGDEVIVDLWQSYLEPA
jgi:nitrile hydratase